MANPFFNCLSQLQHAASRDTMAPPPLATSTLDQSIHDNQNHHANYPGDGLASSSQMYAGSSICAWEPSGLSSHLVLSSSGYDFGGPSENPTRPAHASPNPQHSLGRTTMISPEVWTRHKRNIRKLWIEEQRSLPETIAIMSQKHHFNASQDQYKKQFKKWNWSKYIPAKDGRWMLWKADQRKREQGKNTEFEYRGQKLTETNIRPRLERKKFEPNPQAFSPDAKTPSEINYATPRDHMLSPPENRPAPPRNTQPAWSPPSNLNRLQRQMRLVWNGRTKADFQAQYEEGLGDARSGRADEAEAKIRSALDGLDNLLSTTHPETMDIAYHLASFYAEHVRMKDADTVLDWLTLAHLEDFGLFHPRTLYHAGSVIEMFRNWGRPGDAVEFLKQVLHELDKEEPQSNDARLSTATASGPSTLSTRAENTTTAREQAQASGVPISSTGPIEPSMLQSEHRQTGSGMQGGESVEAMFLRLIRHCEEFPDELMVHSLLYYGALLNHYEDIEDVLKKSDALDRAEQAIWNILRSDQEKTKDLLTACLQLAKYFVEAGRYATADDIFTQIESEAQETFGSDHPNLISFLETIGTFYQHEERWQDAAPRFEHALAARLSRYGERHESVKRLEAALENRHYETYIPQRMGRLVHA